MAIDERATPEQRTALLNIASGKRRLHLLRDFCFCRVHGARSDLRAYRAVERSRQARRQLNIPGLGEFRVEPIKNPVTGEEHRAAYQAAGWLRI